MSDTNENDFADAVALGLEAADTAAEARREINDVLSNVGKAISDATMNRLTTRLAGQRTTGFPLNAVAHLAGMAQQREYVDPEDRDHIPREFQAVVRGQETSGNERSRKLFKIEIPATGYPVVITTEDGETDCYDLESLQSTIGGLLRSARVGRMLRALDASAMKLISDATAEEDKPALGPAMSSKETPPEERDDGETGGE